MQPITWLALGYNAPASPSKNRVYVWRKLKECGAEYFRPGVALLPQTQNNAAKFRMLAEKIREMGGEAVIAELRFCDDDDEAETVARFKSHAEREYNELVRESRGAISAPKHSGQTQAQRDEQLKKLLKRYDKLRSRDYFRSRDTVSQALVDLADDMERELAGLGRQLRRMLEL